MSLPRCLQKTAERRPLSRPWALAVLLAGLGLCPGVYAAQAEAPQLPPAATRAVSFRQDVYPLLAARCFRCHRGPNPSSGHRLDLRAELLGEDNGRPLVRPGASARSRLIQLVAGVAGDKVMPPRGPRLSAAQVGLLRAWIDQGLAWDDQLLPASARPSHWAFQPVSSPAIPAVKDPRWVHNPIDAFIAAGHEARGLTPAPEASRRVLIRRLTFDLTGLPPTPAEVEAFVSDPRPDAYERLADRLLASPHYGERWGRHWLDLARWAESEGYESNHPRRYAWRYRDYVVRAFNEDRPYARFVREQVAGDEIRPYSDDNLVATGFLAAARLSSNEEDTARQRNDVLVDIVNATAQTFLGLTFNCAQCHNHKFDPIPARDYYRFMGFFIKGQPSNLALRDPALCGAYEAARPPEYEPARRLRDLLFERARSLLAARVKKTLPAGQLQALAIPSDRRSAEQEEKAREAGLKLLFGADQVEKVIPAADRPLYRELKKKVSPLPSEKSRTGRNLTTPRRKA
jgi:hypothetical protein